MFDKQQRKLKRSAKLISVLSKYGFKDMIARMGKKPEENFAQSEEAISKGTVTKEFVLL